MKAEYKTQEMDSSGFVVLADFIPSIIQEIRYHSTYNFIGDRVDGYEEPVALEKYIDIEIKFNDSMGYGEVRKIVQQIRERVQEVVGDCIVNVDV